MVIAVVMAVDNNNQMMHQIHQVYKKPAGVKKEKKRSLKELAAKTMAMNVFNVETKTRPTCVAKNQFKKRPRQGASNKRRGSLFDE